MSESPNLDFDPETLTLNLVSSKVVDLGEVEGQLKGGYLRSQDGTTLASSLKKHLTSLDAKTLQALVTEGVEGEEARAELQRSFVELRDIWLRSIPERDLEVTQIWSTNQPHSKGHSRVWTITPDGQGVITDFGQPTYDVRHSKRKSQIYSQPTFTLTLNNLKDYEPLDEEIIFPVSPHITILPHFNSVLLHFPHILLRETDSRNKVISSSDTGAAYTEEKSQPANLTTGQLLKVDQELRDKMGYWGAYALIQSGFDLSEYHSISNARVNLVKQRIEREILTSDQNLDAAGNAIALKGNVPSIEAFTSTHNPNWKDSFYSLSYKRPNFRQPASVYHLDVSKPTKFVCTDRGWELEATRKLVPSNPEDSIAYMKGDFIDAVLDDTLRLIQRAQLGESSMPNDEVHYHLVSTLSRHVASLLRPVDITTEAPTTELIAVCYEPIFINGSRTCVTLVLPPEVIEDDPA